MTPPNLREIQSVPHILRVSFPLYIIAFSPPKRLETRWEASTPPPRQFWQDRCQGLRLKFLEADVRGGNQGHRPQFWRHSRWTTRLWIGYTLQDAGSSSPEFSHETFLGFFGNLHKPSFVRIASWVGEKIQKYGNYQNIHQATNIWNQGNSLPLKARSTKATTLWVGRWLRIFGIHEKKLLCYTKGMHMVGGSSLIFEELWCKVS